MATRIESVYDIRLPAEVRSLMLSFKLAISVGLDGIPLACIGANGYLARLIFWIGAPVATVALAMAVGVWRLLLSRERSISSLLDSTMPIMLRIAFLAFPIVTNVAFEAFSCYEFENTKSFLVTDVSIVCGSDEHARAKMLASIAIALYPIGLFALNGALLLTSRNAIVSGVPTTLSRATAFLHREYKPTAYLWELAEMSRRFLLVGAYVVGPYHPGGVMQLALAAITVLIFLVAQLLLMPYKSFTDNYLATSCRCAIARLSFSPWRLFPSTVGCRCLCTPSSLSHLVDDARVRAPTASRSSCST